MRTIKFRAWDGSRYIYFDNHQYDLVYNDISGWNVKPNIPNFQGEWVSGQSQSKTPDFVLEQFTGLHDKNGKEIYEGDILQYRYQYWVRKYGDQRELVNDILSKNQVVFARGEFRLSAVCNLSQLPVYFEVGENINAEWDSRYSEFEVIGNIHQNQELLTK